MTRNRILVSVFGVALLLGAYVVNAQRASAQLLLVTGEYYVTELRPNKYQIGIALNKGDDTRNWVNVKDDTKINLRKWHGGGFTDVQINRDQLFRVLHPGSKFKVTGGRDWDQTIVAKKIWI